MVTQPEYMTRAVELALENVRSGQGGPFAAVVARNGRLIAEGVNRVTAMNDPTAHAEVLAIRRACDALGTWQLTGCELYTTCEPCPMCLGAVYWARVDRVYFACSRDDAAAAGFDDSLIYQELARPLPERLIPMEPLMRADALAIFAAWKIQSAKVPY